MSELGCYHRIFVYSMQSTGASLFAAYLGQLPDSIAVIDLWSPFTAPALPLSSDVILKATVSQVELESHFVSFKPTLKILFLRHPVDLVASLNNKSHRDYGGKIEDKLEKFDGLFAYPEWFDAVFTYEDFTSNPTSQWLRITTLGVPLPRDADKFLRSPDSLVAFANSSSLWCRSEFRRSWGLGRLDADSLDRIEPRPQTRTSEAWELASRYSPRLLAHYEERS